MRGMSVSKTPNPARVATAVKNKDWPAARLALTVKLAEAVDACDSARDLKSLARSLTPLIDLCERDALLAEANDTTPLARILKEANVVDQAG